MEELIVCGVCLERFDMSNKAPLMLLCGHTFCKTCLTMMNKNGLGIICPNDRTKDLRSLNSLPKNFSLISIIEEMDNRKAKSLKVAIPVKRQNLAKAKAEIEELQGFKKVLNEEQERSLKELKAGFKKVREVVDKKEVELTNSITQTHENLDQKISKLETNFQNYIKNEELELEKLEEIKAKSGEDFELDSSKSKIIEPPSADFEAVKEMVSKLPVKVLLAPSNIENAINKSARILDETLARVSPLNAVFVRDVRVMDGDRFVTGASFVKTWRLRNDGEEAWNEGCWCMFSHGDFSGEAVVVDSAWAGEEVDVSVICVAPSNPGRFRSYWKLVDCDGLVFGPVLWTEIVVFNVS